MNLIGEEDDSAAIEVPLNEADAEQNPVDPIDAQL